MRTITVTLVALLAAGCDELPFELPVDDTAAVDPAENPDSLDVMLPMTEETLAASYLNCATGDRYAAADLLVQQLEWTEVGFVDSVRTAREILENGYCQQLIRDMETADPELRRGFVDILREEGLDPRAPTSEQVDEDDPDTHAAVFKKLWEKIKDIFRPNGGGTTTETKHVTVTIEEGAEFTGDIIICAPTSNPSDPPPFNPDTPPPR